MGVDLAATEAEATRPGGSMSGVARLLIVIPTYNERDNVRALIPALLTAADGADIVVVDDNSPDGTAQVVAGFCDESPRVRLIQRDRKRGIGTAYRSGFALAGGDGYDAVVTMDADFSHAPEDVGRVVAGLAHADVVVGSRYVAGGRIENWPLFRRVLSVTANALARRLLGRHVHDWTSGFRCYRRQVLQSLPLPHITSDGYSFLMEMLFHCNRQRWRIGEVPITFVDRRFGHTKISRAEAYKSVTTLARLVWWRITS